MLSPERPWLRSSDCRRYAREIALILILKLALLIALWFVCVAPSQLGTNSATDVVRQFYAPAVLAMPHD